MQGVLLYPRTLRCSKAWLKPARARDTQARTGGLDDLHQEHPATDLEALAARAVDIAPAPVFEPTPGEW